MTTVVDQLGTRKAWWTRRGRRINDSRSSTWAIGSVVNFLTLQKVHIAGECERCRKGAKNKENGSKVNEKARDHV
jgi:hypothetical protein